MHKNDLLQNDDKREKALFRNRNFVFLQNLERTDLHGLVVGRSQVDLRSLSGLEGLVPADRTQAPEVVLFEAGKPVPGRDQVVALALRVVQKLKSSQWDQMTIFHFSYVRHQTCKQLG